MAVANISISRVSGVGVLWKTRVCVGAESSTFTSWGSALPLSVTICSIYPLERALQLPGGVRSFRWGCSDNGVPLRVWVQRALSPLLRAAMPLGDAPGHFCLRDQRHGLKWNHHLQTIFQAAITMRRRPEVWRRSPDGTSPRQPTLAGSAVFKCWFLPLFGKEKCLCRDRSRSCMARWCYNYFTTSCSAAGGDFAYRDLFPDSDVPGQQTDCMAGAALVAAGWMPP